MEANTEIYVAPKKYKTGTLNFDYNFQKQGNFIGLVKARTDDGTKEYVSRFPFAVGETANKNFIRRSSLAPPVSLPSASITSIPSSTRRSPRPSAHHSIDEAIPP